MAGSVTLDFQYDSKYGIFVYVETVELRGSSEDQITGDVTDII